MARVNIGILGISELKQTGMNKFNSDEHYIYYCGQESLRRNRVAHKVNKKSLKWKMNAGWVISWNQDSREKYQQPQISNYGQHRQHIKKQRHYFAHKGLSCQSYGFLSSCVWMWELNHKESWAPRNDALELWHGENSWESLWLQGDQTSQS